MSEWESIEEQLLNGLDDVFMDIMRLDGGSAWGAFVADAQKRYEEGRAQHADSDSTWDGWTAVDFDKNIREELIDCVIYAAARIVREMRSA